jgi:cell division protein YceG involved in septum cleavage
VIAFAALLAALYVLYATFQPFHGEGEGSVAVTVPAGANAGAIGDLLAERGVVDSGTFFQVNATVTGRRGKLRPGDYTLRRGMSYGGAIDALVTGPKAKVVKTVNVTVPEGLSVREAAPQVDQGPLEGSYLKAARSSRTLRKVRQLGAPRRVDTAEGFLFPATYTLIDGAPARNLVDRQLAAFEENFAKVDLSFAQRKNLTRYDVLIIASMVERETQSDKERGLVASVIYNRLAEAFRSASTPRSAMSRTTGAIPCASPSSSATARTTRA